MKTTKTLFLMSALIALTLNAPGQSWLTNGLVAYYPFSGNANSESGLAAGGVLNGNGITFSSNRFGQANSAVHLAGGGHISITPTPFNVNADFTISFWAKRDDANYSINNYFSTAWDLNGGLNIRTAASGQGLQFIEKMNGSSSYAYIQSLKPTSPYEWHSFACIKQGQNYYLYLNGVLEEWNNIPGTTPDTGSLWLGRAQAGSPCDLVGAMDDVRIYDRALSSNEVAQLYAIESSNFCTPHRATAVPALVNGFVVGATITDGGCGYSNAPLVLIQGGSGAGATATATVNNGRVTAINITGAGIGYTTNPAPRIVIASPPFEPSVGIRFSKVEVTQHVTLGRNYVLESSSDLATWSATGQAFTAVSENYTNEFVVGQTGQFFSLRQVP